MEFLHRESFAQIDTHTLVTMCSLYLAQSSTMRFGPTVWNSPLGGI